MKTLEKLSERSRHILKTLTERYLREGAPVGSKTLANEATLGLSAATVRNIMMDLEDRGYVTSPHTSAGRIPTQLGLRFFIESLLTIHPMDPDEIKNAQAQLDPVTSNENLVSAASGLLSDITQLVGIVSMPRTEQQLLRLVEFLPLSNQRVLVILVLNEQQVQNRIIQTQREYSASELEQAANYLNSVFAGKDLIAIRDALLEMLREDRQNLDKLMRIAIEVADKAFEQQSGKTDFVVAGETNLLALGESVSTQQLRKLFEAFTQKQEILDLLDQCIKASGLQIFIGEEAGDPGFAGLSIVTTPYSVDGKIVGALGVMGPTRMPYHRVIPVVDVTAKLLTEALNSGGLNPI